MDKRIPAWSWLQKYQIMQNSWLFGYENLEKKAKHSYWEPAKNQRPKKYKRIDKKRIKRLLNDGKSPTDIAKIMGISTQAVYYQRKKITANSTANTVSGT